METPPLTPPPPKKQRVSVPSSALDSGKTKVCLVCCAYPSSVWNGKSARFFDIFVLDLLSDKDRIPGDGASEEFKPRNPTFRLGTGCFQADAFCVVGSTLYMFQGFPGAPEGKSVAAFDLTSSNELMVELLPSMLSISHDVLHPKRYPAAIPAGDGKILLFSNFIESSGCCVDFELYDPRTRSAQQLPGIPPQKSGGFWAVGHTLHKESSTFFLQTRIGLFSLHLSVPGAEWVKSPTFFNSHTLPCKSGASYIIGDDELFYAPTGLFDMKRRFARLLYFPSPFKLSSRAGVLLGDDVRNSGDFDFCLVFGGGLDEDTNIDMYPWLSIHYCRCNINTFREDERKTRLLANETLTSFKFLLNTHKYSSFWPYDMFAL